MRAHKRPGELAAEGGGIPRAGARDLCRAHGACYAARSAMVGALRQFKASQTSKIAVDGTPLNVAGIDVGLTLVKPTSGVCRTGLSGEVVAHTFIDRLSRATALGQELTYDVVAIDAPVLPEGQLHYEERPCEKVFVWGAFQKRCKPGESHIRGTGGALRRGGVETAHWVSERVAIQNFERPFPRVFGSRNIVEAFPNAFLGVCLESNSFPSDVTRGRKFDALYDEWLSHGVHSSLRATLAWTHDEFWRSVSANRQHDERAALVCALTALCVLRGSYVAVGERQGGYLFLPPWPLWASWARDALSINRTDSRLTRPVEVWIDGDRFEREQDLPGLAGLAP